MTLSVNPVLRFVAVLLVCAVPGMVRAQSALTPELLASRFDACELLHLSEQGYWGPSGRGTRPAQLDLRGAARLAEEALRMARPLDLRNSRAIQLANASSVQASRVFTQLGHVMRTAGYRSGDVVDTDALIVAAQRAIPMAHARAQTVLCVDLKWGNKRPDWAFLPISRTQYRRIAALFSDAEFAAQAPELAALARQTGLSRRSLFEMRAIRLAAFYFEMGQMALLRDRGDFVGNLSQQRLRATVCTDEATISAGFFQRALLDTGLVRQFTMLRGGVYAHRRPPPQLENPLLSAGIRRLNDRFGLTDHFAPILRDRATGALFVLDSWVEDGGVPPHIAPLARWQDRGEAENVVPLMIDPADAWVDDLLDRRLTTQSGQVARAKRGTAQYQHLQQVLLSRYFGGVRPVPYPDPRVVGLRHGQGRWVLGGD